MRYVNQLNKPFVENSVNNVNNFFESYFKNLGKPPFFDILFCENFFKILFSHFLTELLTFQKIMRTTLRQPKK